MLYSSPSWGIEFSLWTAKAGNTRELYLDTFLQQLKAIFMRRVALKEKPIFRSCSSCPHGHCH
jgi:hypothetical protein